MLVSHDHLPEISKKAALQWFSKKICQHLLGWAMLHAKVLEVDSVFYEEIPDVDVS